MNAISTLNSAPTLEYARQFKAETGWNWNDAVDQSIACANEAGDYAEAERLAGLKLPVVVLLVIDVQPGFMPVGTIDDTLGSNEIAKGWTFADAMDMASEIQRERRIFGGRHGRRSNRVGNVTRRFDAEQFRRETGWTIGDAIDEAATCQRERRIFGNN